MKQANLEFQWKRILQRKDEGEEQQRRDDEVAHCVVCGEMVWRRQDKTWTDCACTRGLRE